MGRFYYLCTEKARKRRQSMRVTLLQTDIEWADPEANMVAARRMMDQCDSHADLYVLPEMWATGFATDPESLEACRAGRPEAPLEWMKAAARQHNAAICGSLLYFDGHKRPHNRHYFVEPDGNIHHYDKRHLFIYGGEKSFVRGEKRCLADFRGVRFMLTTCYDLRFPVWMRNNCHYDVLVCVANWPENRQNVWDTLTKARAIENQCYVIGCNRTGHDKYCQYAGGSAVIDPKGYVVAEAKGRQAQAITADIDIDALQAFRKKFPVLPDADNFSLTDHLF